MRKQYSKKEIKEFLSKYEYAEEFMDKKSRVIEENDTITINGKTAFRKYEHQWIPSLNLLKEHKVLPTIIVDKGTPPFIAKGADLMRPVIISSEPFEKDAVVVIVDETHHYPLATGKTLFSSQELLEQKTGKVVKILHNLTSS